ncbi:MAG: ion channel [Actinomycetes bacterium]
MPNPVESEAAQLNKYWGIFGFICLLYLVLVVGYAFVPVTEGAPVTVGSLLMYLVGIALLSIVVLVMTVREVRGTSRSRTRLQVVTLIAVIVGAVAFFSVSYYRLAKSPGEIADLNTWIDSLYFVLSTILTVGYGDVHATGQVARFEVIIQMLFTVIVLAAAVKLLSALLRKQAHEKIATARPATDSGASPGVDVFLGGSPLKPPAGDVAGAVGNVPESPGGNPAQEADENPGPS